MFALVLSFGVCAISLAIENNEEKTKPYTAGWSAYAPIPMPRSVGANTATDLLETWPSDNTKVINVPASTSNTSNNTDTFSAPSALPETGV